VNTVLMCGACGRRCGVAHRGDDQHHVVVEFRNRSDGRTGGPGDRVVDDVRNATPAFWALTLFVCERCGAVLRLTQDQAKAVGHERRIILAVSTPR
jgi:hypothetical protein